MKKFSALVTLFVVCLLANSSVSNEPESDTSAESLSLEPQSPVENTDNQASAGAPAVELQENGDERFDTEADSDSMDGEEDDYDDEDDLEDDDYEEGDEDESVVSDRLKRFTRSLVDENDDTDDESDLDDDDSDEDVDHDDSDEDLEDDEDDEEDDEDNEDDDDDDDDEDTEDDDDEEDDEDDEEEDSDETDIAVGNNKQESDGIVKRDAGEVQPESESSTNAVTTDESTEGSMATMRTLKSIKEDDTYSNEEDDDDLEDDYDDGYDSEGDEYHSEDSGRVRRSVDDENDDTDDDEDFDDDDTYDNLESDEESDEDDYGDKGDDEDSKDTDEEGSNETDMPAENNMQESDGMVKRDANVAEPASKPSPDAVTADESTESSMATMRTLKSIDEYDTDSSEEVDDDDEFGLEFDDEDDGYDEDDEDYDESSRMKRSPRFYGDDDDDDDDEDDYEEDYFDEYDMEKHQVLSSMPHIPTTHTPTMHVPTSHASTTHIPTMPASTMTHGPTTTTEPVAHSAEPHDDHDPQCPHTELLHDYKVYSVKLGVRGDLVSTGPMESPYTMTYLSTQDQSFNQEVQALEVEFNHTSAIKWIMIPGMPQKSTIQGSSVSSFWIRVHKEGMQWDWVNNGPHHTLNFALKANDPTGQKLVLHKRLRAQRLRIYPQTWEGTHPRIQLSFWGCVTYGNE